MMQQWQQMTQQQKAMAIGLVAVIVIVLLLILWLILGGQQAPPPTATTPTAGTPTSPSPSGVTPGMLGGTPSLPTAPSGAGTPPELAGLPPSGGLPGGEVPSQPSQPPTPSAAPQPGKLTRPPKPGRTDPFAALPEKPVKLALSPFLPPSVPPPQAEEPIVEPIQAREQPIERIPRLPISQAPSIDLTRYLASRPPSSGAAEGSGWRMVGFLMSEQRVSAILQAPDGKNYSVKPGSTVSHGGTTYTVVKIEPDRLLLRDEKGEEFTVTRRPVQTLPGGMMPPPYGGGASPYGGGGSLE